MSINFTALEKIKSNIKLYSPNTDLIIVTKKQPVEDVLSLMNNDYAIFAENKVQEASQKYKDLRKIKKFKLHMIGPLQSNKVESALQIFDTIQSIDRVKLVETIIKYQTHNKDKIRTQNFFIQINIGDENQKFGIQKNEFKDFYFYCKEHIPIEGLMCIPPLGQDPKIFFDLLVSLKNKVNPNLKLSMGMSADYEDALIRKTNYIRVGSMIFN